MRVCLVILVACAHPPPRPPAVPEDIRARRAIEPAPELATPGLPAPVEDLWPLAHAPIAAPHLELADAFGVTTEWGALCERRPDPVRKADRDEVLDYLYAWCHAGAGKIAHAGGELAGLAHGEKSPRVASAAVDDLPDVLAFADADVAMRGKPDLDRLAAEYLAFDRFEDAAIVMRALASDAAPSATARCHRLVRDYLLVVGDRTELAAKIQQSSDPVCAEAKPMFDCPVAYGLWAPPTNALDLARCQPLVDAQPWLASRLHLARVHQKWRDPLDSHGWLRFALDESAQSFALPGVEEAALRALENAAITADCARDLPAIQAAAAALVKPEHERELDERILALRALTPATCHDWQSVPR